MGHLALAAETLKKAETDLRDIVAKAAVGGDYAGVVRIASWAKAIRDLLERKPTIRDNGADLASTNGGVMSVVQAKNGRTLRKKQASEYPRFFRKGDELVRVAWSRRARSEYQHKTSEAVLKSVTETLSRLGTKGRIFSTDEVLPLRDPQGSEVPAYQAYVCIALLKMTGLIEQHGRQGYSISTPAEFTDAVDAIWRKLPSSK
jgi:hypothetical protein